MKTALSRIVTGINKIIVVLLLAVSVYSIFSPFFIIFFNRNQELIHYLEIHHTIRRLLSFIILIVAWKLYKRVSAAWTIVMLALSGVIFQHLIVHHDKIINPWFVMEIISYFVLLLSKNYYCRKMDRYSLKKGMLVYSIYALFVFLNATIALLKDKGMVALSVCIRQTLDVMLDLDNLNLAVISQNALYHRFIFWFSWICIFVGLVLVLTPYISIRIQTQEEIERARELVKRFGQNCSSYLALERDKRLLFGESVEGVAAYGIVRDIMVVLGDPICDAKDISTFLTEIKNYCEKNAFGLLFLNTTGMFLKEYERFGIDSIKCGEEPRIVLQEYSLAGGKASKVRLNINHATNAGLRILEYEPLKERNLALEKQIMEVSQEWFSMKKSSELVFTMGGIGFDNPMERRYFYAMNSEDLVEGFIVFVPYKGMKGYMTDVTRHRKNAARGVMEKILYEAMMSFKEEGIEEVSLAPAPLARLEEEPEVTARILNTIYERMNGVYGFKTLYQTKLKYNPTYWEPVYYVYYPAVFTPALAYAIIKIQNPLGLKDYIRSFFHERH
ncbi:MAG: bifunctional lysylphosphatidylglycerol flippase/synthetase MprF [Pseudomonadota bacterium]